MTYLQSKMAEGSRAVRKLFEDYMDKKKKDAIKFTIERQVDNKLPFLNVLVVHTE